MILNRGKISEIETKTIEVIKGELNPATKTVTKPSLQTYAEIIKEKKKRNREYY